jgi:predicted unusual protein kinase regulating ubiquinone biosynthesis (AarF/ABC1/UbiB family)
MPTEVLAMYRALLTAETVASQLDSEVDLLSVGEKFFARLLIRRSLEGMAPERLQSLAIDLPVLIQDAPGQIQRILYDLANDRFSLEVRTTESPEDRRAASSRSRLITAAILSVGLSILLAAGALGDGPLSSGAVSGLLAVLLGMDYLWMLILWRRLR